MRNHYLIAGAVFAVICVAGLHAEELTNLARKAKVSASSEYNSNHLARWAVDGKVPEVSNISPSVVQPV